MSYLHSIQGSDKGCPVSQRGSKGGVSNNLQTCFLKGITICGVLHRPYSSRQIPCCLKLTYTSYFVPIFSLISSAPVLNPWPLLSDIVNSFFNFRNSPAYFCWLSSQTSNMEREKKESCQYWNRFNLYGGSQYVFSEAWIYTSLTVQKYTVTSRNIITLCTEKCWFNQL